MRLAYLSESLFNAESSELLANLQSLVSSENPASITIDFHIVQDLLRNGLIEEASAFYTNWKSNLPENFNADGYLEWMDLLLEFSDTSDERVADSIVEWVRQRIHPHDLYLLTADVLASRKNFRNAELIIREGTRHYTFNESIKRKRERILLEKNDLENDFDAQGLEVASERIERARDVSSEAIQQIQLQRMRESTGAADEIARARLNNSPSEVNDEIARKRLEGNKEARERVEELARERLEYLRNQD